jgi:hypothetical protein
LVNNGNNTNDNPAKANIMKHAMNASDATYGTKCSEWNLCKKLYSSSYKMVENW